MFFVITFAPFCRVCNFDYNKRIFNNNERQILIDRYFIFSFILRDSSLIDLCRLIFIMYHIFYLLLLHLLNFDLFLFKRFR